MDDFDVHWAFPLLDDEVENDGNLRRGKSQEQKNMNVQVLTG